SERGGDRLDVLEGMAARACSNPRTPALVLVATALVRASTKGPRRPTPSESERSRAAEPVRRGMVRFVRLAPDGRGHEGRIRRRPASSAEDPMFVVTGRCGVRAKAARRPLPDVAGHVLEPARGAALGEAADGACAALLPFRAPPAQTLGLRFRVRGQLSAP